MKSILFFALLFSISTGVTAQTSKFGDTDTTSKLPKGTKFVNGKVTIQSGYKGVYSSDKKMVFILRSVSNGAVVGGFTCSCGLGGSCSITYDQTKIYCVGDACCGFSTTSSDLTGLTMQNIEQAPEKLTWKNVVLPKQIN